MSEVRVDTDSEDRMREIEAAIARRLVKVERELATARRRGTVAGVTMALALLLAITALGAAFTNGFASGPHPVVETRRLVVSDASGLARAVVEVTDDRAARFVLRDTDGRERIRLALLRDGSPGVTVLDRDGRPRVVLGLLPDGSSNLVFGDAEGSTRVVLGTSGDDAASLALADADGVARATIGVSGDGAADFTLYETVAPTPVTEVPSDTTPTP